MVHEGISGMFKGLGPNIMGVAPTRAIYFWSYNTCKKKIDASVPKANRDTSLVHVVSAAAAGEWIFFVTHETFFLLINVLQLSRFHLLKDVNFFPQIKTKTLAKFEVDKNKRL